jgi:hypothetical protein
MQHRVGAMRQWGAALGEDPARRLHYDGRGTPPSRPPPPPRPPFVSTPPGLFSSGTQPSDWSAQRDDQHFRDPLYSDVSSMNPFRAYAPNSFMTPPHLTSTAWATQQSTPTPTWDGPSTSLISYDQRAEDTRLHQAFSLGTSAGNTLMQRSTGIYYGTIFEACQARRSTLQRTMRRYPLLSRGEYERIVPYFTFGTKQITRRLERAKATNNCGERENFGRDPTDAE